MTTMLNDKLVTEMYGDKEARWFQVSVRNQTRAALVEGYRRICIIQPTGTGKTISSGLILIDDGIRDLLGVGEDEDLVVLFCSHRKRLLTQAEKTYAECERLKIVTHSIMSELPDNLKFHIVVIDECHHEATLSFQHQLERISVAPIIGLTATPDRNDGRLCKFDHFIEPLTRDEAVAQGFLAESDVFTFVDSPTKTHVEISLEIISLHHQIMGQQMVFAKTKEEGQALLEGIRSMGLTAELLVDITEKELNEKLAEFERKEHQFCISCMKLGEGVDVKGCEGVLIARTLKSRGLLNQIIGRAARLGSDCRIFEIINPMASDNISAIDIVGVPRSHNFFYKVRGQWRQHVLT